MKRKKKKGTPVWLSVLMTVKSIREYSIEKCTSENIEGGCREHREKLKMGLIQYLFYTQQLVANTLEISLSGSTLCYYYNFLPRHDITSSSSRVA